MQFVTVMLVCVVTVILLCACCSDRSGCEMVRLFGSKCDNGVNNAIGAQHTMIYLGEVWSHFLAVSVI